MVLRRGTGLGDLKSIPDSLPCLGLTDQETVKLDFDDTSFKTVKYWSSRACRFFKLEGFIILKSSRRSYHVIFNRPVNWDRNVHIMDWVARLSKIETLIKYSLMQGIKESSTLRVGPKYKNPSPRIVYRYGKQDKKIKEFLEMRKTIDHISKNLEITRAKDDIRI